MGIATSSSSGDEDIQQSSAPSTSAEENKDVLFNTKLDRVIACVKDGDAADKKNDTKKCFLLRTEALEILLAELKITPIESRRHAALKDNIQILLKKTEETKQRLRAEGSVPLPMRAQSDFAGASHHVRTNSM